MARQAIPPEQLRWQPEPDELPGETTKEIPPLDGTLGQVAALETLHYGISSPGHNQHLFLRGPRGSGRLRLIESLFSSLQPSARQARDFCFVHNFSSPDRPRLIMLPRGEGRPFYKQMHRIALFIRERLPDILANDPIRGRREARREAAERDVRVLLRPLEKKLEDEGLALIRSQAGPNARLQVAVKIMGKPVSLEEFRNMVARKQATDEDRKILEARIKSYDDELQKVGRQIRSKWQQAQQHIEQIDITETARILGEMTADIGQRFKAPRIETYLREVIDDVLEKRIGHETAQLADPTVLYGVNVFKMGYSDGAAPVVSTNVMSPGSLFGTIDPAWRSSGRAVASFLGIRAGSLIQADGGFLLLDAEDLASEPGIFHQLLRILRTGSVAIAAPTTEWNQAQSLQPQSVPIDVGVILLGDHAAYHKLESLSSEFSRRFRLLADLDDSIPRDREGVDLSCRFLAALVQRESLPPLTRTGLAATLEISSRATDQAQRLTAKVGRLCEVVREAAFLAGEDRATEIGREQVEAAFDRIRRRAGRPWMSRMQRELDCGTLRLRGRSIAQLNVIGRTRCADEFFGLPASLDVALARNDHATLSFESRSGQLHVRRFLWPLITELLKLDFLPRWQAALSLETALDPDDADSTLLGQICVLIGTLAGLPLHQDLAVVGRIDARGQLGNPDRINERIEAYFHACNESVLNGQQGVIIPDAARDRLMLDRDVVRACTSGQFHVYGVASVGEALELLTGKQAGKWKGDGFGEQSVFGLARAAASV